MLIYFRPIRYLIFFLMTKFKIINKKISKTTNIYDALEFIYSSQYLTRIIKIAQLKFEISGLLELLKNLRPKVILEIGTAGGGTLYLFTRIADPEAILTVAIT